MGGSFFLQSVVAVLVAAIPSAVVLSCRSAAPLPQLALVGRVQVTLDPGLEIEPTMSPDGRLVAYAAGSMNAVGDPGAPAGGRRPRSPWPLQSERPQRFPILVRRTATQIMFDSPRGGIEARLSPGGPGAAGGARRATIHGWTRGAAAGPLMPAGWSPHGLTHRVRALGTQSVPWSATWTEGPPRPLTQDGEMHSFAWSPDGRWIACVRGNRQSRQPSFMFGNIGPTLVAGPRGWGRSAPSGHRRPVVQRQSDLDPRQPDAALPERSCRRQRALPAQARLGRSPCGGPCPAHQWTPGASREPLRQRSLAGLCGLGRRPPTSGRSRSPRRRRYRSVRPSRSPSATRSSSRSTCRRTALGCCSTRIAAARWTCTGSRSGEVSPSGSPSHRRTSSGPSGRRTARRSPFTPSSMAVVASSSCPPTAAASSR